ncbi:nucleotidyltransferase family protein [Streptomyces armeniacus]|uniref:Nucleotidyltransferase family protein n=1 Tax=Streptomyces armeniacus TaxID=83291 RepID=A0A345XI34_9ACTN|nr:nucleotidyltransferase family protein [Streptomyces armeniacus]AXK31300.1 nucleotidyltransferase family protein [Streptomyces armeniacus]
MTTSETPLPGAPAPVAALLLAAGGGRRLGGRPKALLPHHGRPLVEHAVRVLRAGGCDPAVRVVLGATAAHVRERADLSGCVLLDNPDWEQGMGSSLRAGLAALSATAPAPPAALVFLVDQPGITAAAVARVLRTTGHDPAVLAAATYGGHRGHPVLLGADHWPGVVREAGGDRGARGYLRAHAAQLTLVECGDVADPADIDTPDDLRRLAP